MNTSFIVEDIEYKDADDFINNGFYYVESEVFEDIFSDIVDNQFKGKYIVTTIMDNDEKLIHEFIFIRNYKGLLVLSPIRIPERNMFNSEEEISEIIYEYEAFKISNYKTKTSELIDFEGNKRKKKKSDKTVKIDGVNFLIEENDFNLKEFMNSFLMLDLDEIDEEYLTLMKENNYDGIYCYVHTLKTGEQINAFYEHYSKEDNLENNQIAVYPPFRRSFLKLHNIPDEIIIESHLEYMPYSSRLATNYYGDFEKYLYHQYEGYKPHDMVLVPKKGFSEEIFEKIGEYKNKCKLVYSFETKEGKIEETYEFYKFRKSFQYNEEFVILKTMDLPVMNWFNVDLCDIVPGSEEWTLKL